MKAVKILFGVAVTWMLAGCHLAETQPEDAGAVRRFTQVSLFGTLLCGRYGGVVDLGWVKGRGNLMIATMDRLDGEAIPYGTIADFRPETTDAIGPIASYEEFEAAIVSSVALTVSCA